MAGPSGVNPQPAHRLAPGRPGPPTVLLGREGLVIQAAGGESTVTTRTGTPGAASGRDCDSGTGGGGNNTIK